MKIKKGTDMQYISRLVIAALTLVGASVAQSAVISYQGTITPVTLSGPGSNAGGITSPFTTVTGSVGGFGWIRQQAADVDFWSFQGIAGQLVSIQGTRRDPGLDPVLDLYYGTTTADESLFRTGQDWGGLQFLVSSDDVIDPVSGPFGDPFVSFFRLTATGNYTIAIGGAGSDGEGPYPYDLSVQLVPEPVTALLVVTGIAGIGWTRRSLNLKVEC